MKTTRNGRRARSSIAIAGGAAALAASLIASPLSTSQASAETPDGTQGNAIVNLFQWSWNSIAKECTDEIGPAGFGYVQVSPPQEHVQGTQWWTSYQPVSYQIESKLGTRDEFAAMVQACGDAGVGVIADAVINHTAGADRGSGTGVAGSPFAIDDFPAIPYSAEDFNDCKTDIDNYQNRETVQNCRLVSLQDLRTSSEDVRNTIAAYLNDLVSLGVKGFRIDAAKHIPASDLEAIKAKLPSDVYWVHEVIGAAGEPITPSEYVGSGDVHEFDYARGLKHAFDGDIQSLKSIADGKLDSSNAGVFVDNHDTERNNETMNYKWGAKYLLGNVFLLSFPYGSPSVYSGYEFSDKDAGAPGATGTSVADAACGEGAFTCSHRQTEIVGMVGFYNQTRGQALTDWWSESNLISYGRGAEGHVVINNRAEAVTNTFQTSLPAGEYCDVVADETCEQTVTVDAAGTIDVTIPAYGALAIHAGATAD